MSKKLKQIIGTQDFVIKLLKKAPYLRDDDYKLVANVWHNELKALKINSTKISAFYLLKLYSQQILTQADVITRARRKVQEENIELRGELWNERHELESEIRQKIVK